ncbi:hemolysin family protein [Helicobacter sp. 16-1353]|uniref:hemolysin family protein n=1 Tax=Helicobacter sp. 16-1353 TaxID=2004996 RepID=UPI00215D3442|nr:hemolysin family protein [Helicobacter sp. 16-1353]
MESSTSQLLMIILAIVFVGLNGFFVLSEFAIVKVRRSKLEELAKKNKGNAKLALKITKTLDTYLSATQLGITLSSLALGWIGEPAIARVLEKLFHSFFVDNPILLHTISFIIAFTIITVLHVVCGELIPKSIAIARAEQATLIVARPLHLFRILFFPLIKVFDTLAGFFLKRIGIEPAKENDSAHSDEEIKIIIGESLKGGYLDSIESEILKNAVDFSDTTAKEIMTPRKDIICLFENNSYDENIEIVKQTNHTRYPYCKEGKDNVLGMIHIRDLLQSTLQNKKDNNLSSIVRELIIVPETTSISSILMKMNKKQIHTALVVDEYGGTAGLLTMEDIIEEIMGDISDEHDKKNDDIIKIDDNTYEIDGMLDIDSVAETLDFEIPEDVEQVTIGGYVFNLLEKEPIVGDNVVDGNFVFEVLEVDGMRIKKIRAKRLQDKLQEDENEKEAMFSDLV